MKMFNYKIIENFINIASMSEKELLAFLGKKLKKIYKKVYLTNDYVYALGEEPYCLVAHLDTVHRDLPKTIMVDWHTQNVISAFEGIGGDDRCGVFMILSLLERGLRPSILFCTQEEVGGIGAEAFCKDFKKVKNVNFFLEFDRKGANDVVRYRDDNEDLTRYFEEYGFKEASGSFSDISVLCPHFEISGVNVSCGYYLPHTTEEYVVISEMMDIIDRCYYALSNFDAISKKYTYVESIIHSHFGSSKYFNDWYYERYTQEINEDENICEICGMPYDKYDMVESDYGPMCKYCAEEFDLIECPDCGYYSMRDHENCGLCGKPLPSYEEVGNEEEKSDIE